MQKGSEQIRSGWMDARLSAGSVGRGCCCCWLPPCCVLTKDASHD